MHGVRGICNLIFLLVLISGIIFPVVFADQTTNITDPVATPGSENATFNQSVISTVTSTTTLLTPEPMVTETLAFTPATTEPTPEPTVTEALTLTPATTEPTPEPTVTETVRPAKILRTQNPVDLSVTTLVTTIPPSALVSPTPTTVPTEGTCSDAPTVSGGTCQSSSPTYPLMHLSKAQLDEEEAQYRSMEKYAPPVKQKNFMMDGDSGTVSKSLLSYISYVPAERNQGACGDCWVWASTGVLEVEHAVKTGVNERLSTQYFNSKYENGQGDDWACCGGNLYLFTNWYNSDKTPIPWSNTNAAFGDKSRVCGYNAANNKTAVPIGTISTTPHYYLNSISYSSIPTTGVGQSTAIANIKSYIDNNKAIYYSFHYGTTGWSAFNSYWSNQAESVIFNPDSYGGQADAGGHGVVIVGYDTSDPSNPYWVVLNSWGITSGRPNGLFRLKMNMNYDNTYGSGWYQHKFYVMDAEFEPADKFGVFRDGYWYMDYNGNLGWDATDASMVRRFGDPGDSYPVVGDWNGDGKDEFGLFRDGYWYMDYNGNLGWDATDASMVRRFGDPGDSYPVVGDWNGDGKDEFGLFRDGYWYMDYNGNLGWDATDASMVRRFGDPGDSYPVVGDWNGDGKDEFGLFRDGYWYMDYNGNLGWDATDASMVRRFGDPGDSYPVVGDWNGDGKDEFGLFRDGYWYMDYNGNLGWDATDASMVRRFGDPGDNYPVAGKWS